MDLEREVYKWMKEIVCEPLLPQEYEMEYITKYESMLHNNKPTMLHIARNAYLMVVIYHVMVNNNHLVLQEAL